MHVLKFQLLSNLGNGCAFIHTDTIRADNSKFGQNGLAGSTTNLTRNTGCLEPNANLPSEGFSLSKTISRGRQSMIAPTGIDHSSKVANDKQIRKRVIR